MRLKRKEALRIALILIGVFSLVSSLIGVPEECRDSDKYCIQSDALVFMTFVNSFFVVFVILIVLFLFVKASEIRCYFFHRQFDVLHK